MVDSRRSERRTDVTDALSRYASDLYDDARLTPMLTQLIRTSCRLGDSMGGSVSLVDETNSRYTKVAEIGTACRLGQSFPLHEGVTGRVLRHRGPVVLRTYRELGNGHLKAGPAADGAVVAIPVWWRADIVAVNVVFAGVARSFTTGEVDQLELVTQVVAAGLVSAVDRELPGSSFRRVRSADLDGARAAPAISSVNDVVIGLIELTQRATAASDESAPSGLQVRVLGDTQRPRLLFRPEPDAGEEPCPERPWHELVDGADGVVEVHTPDLVPFEPVAADGAATGPPCPFSAREREVAALLVEGLSDRAIASALFVSPKTVEKHVSAVLRKTGTGSRTGAVVRCLEHHWT